MISRFCFNPFFIIIIRHAVYCYFDLCMYMSACVFSSRRVKFKVTGLIKWEFEYTLFAFQDELVDRLLSTPTEISKLVATLKKKKAEDIDNLTAEHLQYGGSTISDYLASTINNIFYTKYVPDSIKKELLMAVPKKDKDLLNPSNYRGITVISIICKLLEMCIRARIEGTLEKQQNKLRKRFTKGAFSINRVSRIWGRFLFTV